MPELSICIMRLSAIGDVTHVVPVVRAIRGHDPDARITWIIGKLEARLLAGLDGVEFIVFDKKGGLGAVKQLRQALKGRSFDVLLHMQVAARANLLSTLVKAPVRIGWDRPRWRDRHQWFINRSVRSIANQHQVDAFLEFARALDAPVGAPEWNLPGSAVDAAWAQEVLGGDPAPILMISPCSSHPLRNWDAGRYAAVADHAISAHGMRVVLTGGPSELEMTTGQAIETAMHSLQGDSEEAAQQHTSDSLCMNCASLVAKNLGASEEEMVMVAGFAGGLGLSGGGCGALSAAIWKRSLDWCRENPDKSSFKNPEAVYALGAFEEQTGGELRCSALTGHLFHTLQDHHDYIADGGCKDRIRILSRPV